jgi:hypothetical protein
MISAARHWTMPLDYAASERRTTRVGRPHGVLHAHHALQEKHNPSVECVAPPLQRSIRTKWIRDICSVLFSGYYIVDPDQADPKVRLYPILLCSCSFPAPQLERFRAVPTVEMLCRCWQKTSNPYARLIRFRAYFAV